MVEAMIEEESVEEDKEEAVVMDEVRVLTTISREQKLNTRPEKRQLKLKI